jgi:putative glutamine amidotransferase
MFQIAHGGKLAQHIDDHRHPDVHDAHTVYVEASTRLHAITGATEFHVNSRHHQAAIDPPGSLTISARAEDGTIEALERPDLHFALAVQWHPEDRVRTSEPDRRLFEAFSEACRR